MVLKRLSVVCFVVVVTQVDHTFGVFGDKDLGIDFSDILEKLFHHDKKVIDTPDCDIDKEQDLLHKLLSKDIDIGDDHGIDIGSHLKSKELLKLLPLLHGKDKVKDSLDCGKVDLGDHDHGIDLDAHDLLKSKELLKLLGDHDHGIDLDSHDLLKSSELSKMLPLLLAKAKLLGLLDHDHDLGDHDHKIDLDSHDLLKSSELTKILPLLLTKAKLLGLLDHDHDFDKFDLGDHGHDFDLLKTSEYSKIIPLLLMKAKLLGLLDHDHDHDLLHMDDKLGLDDHLEKLLPLLLLKMKLLHPGHDSLDLGHDVGGHAAGSAALAKILPLLLAKEKLDSSIDLDHHHHDHHDLFDFDDSIWALLKGMKAAEVAKILPILLGKEKCDLLGLGNGFDLDDKIWDLCKGLEGAELAKILPLLLAKGKEMGSIVDKGGQDLGPLMQGLMAKKGMVPDKPVEHDRDYFLDQLKYHGVNIQADDCYDCYYDDSGFYYTLQR